MNTRTSQTTLSPGVILIILLSPIFSANAQLSPSNFFSEKEIDAANTAKDADYLTQEEKDIFLYNNLARIQPKKFHSFYVMYTESKGYEGLLKTDHYYKTLSTDLLNRQPSGPMYPDKKMFELAECWAVESGELGIVGHDRVSCPEGYSGENCSYGFSDGLDIVMQLLVDHGVESLGHRKNMLNPGWKGMGTAIRPHADYRFCAVQNFTRTNDELRAKAEQDRIAAEKAAADRKQRLEERSLEFQTLLGQFTTAEQSAADAGRSLNYLTEFEKDFYFYLNLVRMFPSKFKRLIWDEGPYFDQFKEEQEDLINESGFKQLEKYLSLTNSKPAFVPEKEYMDAGRCVVEKWRSGGNSTSCLPGPGAWRLQTFYPETHYKDFIATLTTSKDFDDLLNKNAHMIVVDEGGQAVKVFIR